MKYLSLIMILSAVLISCNSPAQKYSAASDDGFNIAKTESEWKAELTPEAFKVLRQQGTERAFSSPLNDNHQTGTYVCAGCGTPLFKSDHKFDSGTGWPSFNREISGNVAFKTQKSFGSTILEEHCANCGGHLGHVFNDGPRETTGKRHCVNGVALKFIPSNE